MLSRNGKHQYICPRCHNPDIKQIRMYGQKSFECRNCNRWFAWSLKKEIPVGEKRMLMEDYKFCIGMGLGLLLAGIFMTVVWSFTYTREQFLIWSCAIVGVQAVVTMGIAHYQFKRKR